MAFLLRTITFVIILWLGLKESKSKVWWYTLFWNGLQNVSSRFCSSPNAYCTQILNKFLENRKKGVVLEGKW